MDYRKIRNKYIQPGRVVSILVAFLIIFFHWMIKDLTLQTLSILLLIVCLSIFVWFNNTKYLKRVETLIYVDMDLDSLKQYIQINKNARSLKLQIDAKTIQVMYFYMIGDFDSAIQNSQEILNDNKVKQQYKNILQNYMIRSTILSRQNMDREELDSLLRGLTISDAAFAEKTKNLSRAIYDLTIAHQSNDYFENDSHDYKYQQLEINYFQAMNASIKGDITRATDLLNQLSKEDDTLYIVRMAKNILASM